MTASRRGASWAADVSSTAAVLGDAQPGWFYDPNSLGDLDILSIGAGLDRIPGWQPVVRLQRQDNPDADFTLNTVNLGINYLLKGHATWRPAWRKVLETARRYPPGHLPRPERAGAEPRPVCARSGLRPANGCATIMEWFLPGTEPTSPDHWERGGRVHLPLEYADWSARNGAAAGRPALAASAAARAPSDPTASPRRIVSPAAGDIYAVPTAVDARYATIPLVASQGDGVRWWVNDAPVPGGRWPLAAGEHRITAVWPDGARDSATVRVAP